MVPYHLFYCHPVKLVIHLVSDVPGWGVSHHLGSLVLEYLHTLDLPNITSIKERKTITQSTIKKAITDNFPQAVGKKKLDMNEQGQETLSLICY